MGAFDFAVFNADGTGELVVTQPRAAQWLVAVVDETPDGEDITLAEVTAVWYFPEDVRQAIAETELAAIMGKRQGNGTIRLRTTNYFGQYVVCDGKLDAYPPVTRMRGRVPGLVLTFRYVLPV